MLDQTQAKLSFRTTLSLLLAAVFWPVVAIFIASLLAMLNVKNLSLILILMIVIWLALFVWLFIQCWKLAPEAGTTPWATLWIFLPFFGIFIVSMLILEPIKYLADNKPADKQLPTTWKLIKETWKFYTENFKASVKISLLFLYTYIVVGAIMAVVAYFKPLWVNTFPLILIIPLGIMSAWITLKLLHQTAAQESGQVLEPLKNSGRKLLSFIWIFIEMMVFSAGPLILVNAIFSLTFVMIVGWSAFFKDATEIVRTLSLGASAVTMLLAIFVWGVLIIASVAWLIYKSAVWNSFTMPVFILQDKKSLAALKESDRLAKSRWWGLYWKNFMSGMVFGGYSMLISLGMSVAALILTTIFQALNMGYIFTEFMGQALNGVVQMIIMPLLIVFTVKLYRVFLKTAG
ncbi:MAG: hypothetical protein PHC53_01060 [Patescibacteria group bacterium]|nr:hypothetical protein [Patescibacteria group bacterium]